MPEAREALQRITAAAGLLVGPAHGVLADFIDQVAAERAERHDAAGIVLRLQRRLEDIADLAQAGLDDAGGG